MKRYVILKKIDNVWYATKNRYTAKELEVIVDKHYNDDVDFDLLDNGECQGLEDGVIIVKDDGRELDKNGKYLNDDLKLETNTDLKYEIESKISEQNTNISNLEKRSTQIQNEILNNISELDNTKFTKEEIEKGFYEIQKDKNSVEKEQILIKESKQKVENEIKNIDIKFNNSIQELNFKQSKLNFLIETEKEKLKSKYQQVSFGKKS